MVETKATQLKEENLVIESITLLDGVTPDPDVQYKVGRNVAKIVSEGIGSFGHVFYDERKVWRTFPLQQMENSSEKVILTDKRSIYTFSKQK